jgi:hypothetical protein
MEVDPQPLNTKRRREDDLQSFALTDVCYVRLSRAKLGR